MGVEFVNCCGLGAGGICPSPLFAGVADVFKGGGGGGRGGPGKVLVFGLEISGDTLRRRDFPSISFCSKAFLKNHSPVYIMVNWVQGGKR